MAVPVQTWGSMGSLVAEQREFGEQTADYLEAHEVHDLFGHLLRQVVVNQPAPEKLYKFLQDQLRAKPPVAVCVIGPPGTNRAKYCASLAAEYKVQHIHIGKLLSQAARQKKDIKDVMDSGVLVDDAVVIELVKAETHKYAKTGWVLDGFPRTKVQAQAICTRETGFALDKVILLHTGEETIRANLAAKLSSAGQMGRDKEELVNSRLQQYQRHVISVAELLKNVIRQIDVSGGDEGFDAIMSVIKGNLHVRPYANVPLRSHRICLVGAPGSGRTTYAKTVAKHYGLIHVDVAVLLRLHQQMKGRQLEPVPPEWVSDEELCAIVGNRLRQMDCMRKGWVLDGFPKTHAQAEFLRQAHHWPTRMVHLTASEDTVVDRVTERKVDPVTGHAYYKAPASAEIAKRLVTADYDTADKVRERYKLHVRNVETVLRTFPMVASSLSLDDNIGQGIRLLFERIDEPTAAELAQSAQQE